MDFKTKLAGKIKNTFKRAESDPDYTTFLKHFGEFKVAKIDQTESSGQEYIIEELKGLRRSIHRIEQQTYSRPRRSTAGEQRSFKFSRALNDSEKTVLLDLILQSHADAIVNFLEGAMVVRTGKPLSVDELTVIKSVLSRQDAVGETSSENVVETA